MEVNEADVSWVAAPGGKSGVGVVRWRSKVLHASPFLRAPHPARAAHLLRQWRYAQHPAVLKSLNITPCIINFIIYYFYNNNNNNNNALLLDVRHLITGHMRPS
jgi:hypothetical protein